MKEDLEKIKENLEELTEYVNDFFHFLPIAVCDLTPNFYILQANRAFEKLSGFDLLKIVGEPVEKIFLEKERLKEVFSFLAHKNIVENKEFSLITFSGEKKPVSTFWGKRKRGEETMGFFLAIVDITHEKRGREEMEEKIRQRTLELSEKIEEMENFQKIAIGRELKMRELKKEIENLKVEIEVLRERLKKGVIPPNDGL